MVETDSQHLVLWYFEYIFEVGIFCDVKLYRKSIG